MVPFGRLPSVRGTDRSAVEAAGISTVSMSNARSITAAANPPRAVYLDYPLGQTAGRVTHQMNRTTFWLLPSAP